MVGVRGQGRRFDIQIALDNAMEVFWRHGYEGASIADLTQAIGIKTSSLYAAFGDKRHLFELVIERYLETKGRFTSLAFEEETGSLRLIRRLLSDAAIEYVSDGGPGGCLIVSAANCVTDANRDVAEKLEAHRCLNIKRIEDVFASRSQNGGDSQDGRPYSYRKFRRDSAVWHGSARPGWRVRLRTALHGGDGNQAS